MTTEKTTEKHECSGRTHPNGSWYGYACQQNAKYFEPKFKDEEPQWWCHHHAPSKIAERKAKKEAAWQATYGADEERREAGVMRAQQLHAHLGVQFGTHYNGYSKQYTGGVTLNAEEADKLIAMLIERQPVLDQV